MALIARAATQERLVIEAPPELAGIAEQLRRVAERGFEPALLLTGLEGPSAPIRVALVTEDHPIARRTPQWVSGFADGSRRAVILFPSRVSSYPYGDMATLLHHEVAHVLLWDAARGRPIPRWFNEGVATVAAREWGLEDRRRYAMAVLGRGPRSTRELEAAFAGDRGQRTRAYALSAAFVRQLRSRHGSTVTARILSLVAGGAPFESAFLRATGTDLARAEWLFFERQAFWFTWVPFLTSSVALWMGITALALLAIVRRRARSAAIRRRWDEEESSSEG
jgi:hypothetical protein